MGVCRRQGVPEPHHIPQADRMGWSNDVKSIPPAMSHLTFPLSLLGIFGAASEKLLKFLYRQWALRRPPSISMSGLALNAIKLIPQQMPSNRCV